MPAQDRVLDLIGSIYRVATDELPPTRLAEDIARAFDTGSCLVYFACEASPGRATMPAVSGILSGTSNFDDWACAAYANYYHERNAWYSRAWRLPAPYVVLGQQLIDTPSLLKTEWSDYLTAMHTRWVIGAQFPISEELIGLLGVHRSPQETPFDEHDRECMARILPHLQRAIRMRARFAEVERRATVAGSLVDDMGIGVVVLDPRCRIGYCNEAARAVLRLRLGLYDDGGRLRMESAADQGRLERAVQEATRHGTGDEAPTGATLMLRRLGRVGLPLMIAPLTGETIRYGSARPACVALFSDPQRPTRPCSDLFARRHGLTGAQARLLSALVCGEDLNGYANAAGIGIGTARSHLKEILRKTELTRQIDLVRAVLADPLSRLPPAPADSISPASRY
jgi:hypothetical protein